MTCFPWPTVEWKFTGDGLLTFFGGLLAFFALLYQVRHTDKGLRRQLDAEKRSLKEGEDNRRRAVATAILFEIDDSYRSHLRDVLGYFDKEEDSILAVVKPIGANPLPVYVGNASAIGMLPSMLAEVVVHYYGVLQTYLGTLSQYSQGYDLMVQGNQLGKPIMKSLVPRIKKEAIATIQLTFTTCGLLCQFVDIAFAFPRIGVADDRYVRDDARTTLDAATKQLTMELGR